MMRSFLVVAGAAIFPLTAVADVDWSRASMREVNIFYPGQTSIEWVMTGKDHGGARPLEKEHDRCVNCHDQEAHEMGPRIVAGKHGKAPEPTPIPDKRGFIPVLVQAAYDQENLYLRFEWPEGEHTPAPFVEGGKMDPDNPIKLAVMLATDDVKYADQAGCWGTCHHDLKTMPHAPTGQEVSKYITESRTEIEVKGKEGKPRGGWDKLKGDGEIKAELDGGHFMDLLRVKSGKGETEDGYILADRVMKGGQGLVASAKLEAGTWTVVMQRKLNSDKPGDLSLDRGKVYNLGFAIHDDYTAARFHHVSLGYRLGFDNAEAEINAIAQ